MFSGNLSTTKNKKEVKIILTDGTILKGYVFLAGEQRLLDLLNDDRSFLPVECTDGEVNLISKFSIQRLVTAIVLKNSTPDLQVCIGRHPGKTAVAVDG